MSKKKEEFTGTKAILFADGNANKFQEFTGDSLYKEELQEQDYAESKSVVTSESLSLNAGESNDVVEINGQQVSILVFEDGSVYDITKGFRAIVSDNVQKAIDSANADIQDAEDLKISEAKKLEEQKAQAKKDADKKSADEKAAKDKAKSDEAAKLKAEKEAKAKADKAAKTDTQTT